MCKKCVDAGAMGSKLVVDNEGMMIALQVVDGEVQNGVYLGPMTEETVAQIEHFAKEARQMLLMNIAEKPAVLN